MILTHPAARAASLIALSLALATGAAAQTQPSTSDTVAPADPQIDKANEIVVMGQILYRNRSEATEPTLV